MIALTVDCEQFKGKETEQSRKGNIALLKILEDAGAKATFFTTGYFAEKEPEQVKEIHSQGHEIASHGYCHHYRNNPGLELKQDILRSKKILEKAIGEKIAGFRSPQMQYSELLVKTLGEAGFRYDSSLHSAVVPGFYYNFGTPMKPFYPLKDKKVKEIPAQGMPFLRLPIGWYWMRNMGAWWPRLGCKMLLWRKISPVVYFHSWEFTELHLKGPMPFYTRNTGKKFCSLLSNFLRGFEQEEFATVSQLLRSANL